MKLLIASDIHGSAYYCRQLLQAWDREGAEEMLLPSKASKQSFDGCINLL